MSRCLLPPVTTVHMSPSERRLRFHGMPQAASAARLALRGWEAHMEPDRFYDLSLCVSAIVTGSVQRRGPADRRAAEIAVRLQGGRARVELAEREALRIAAPAPPEQMGIALIAGVADRWGVLSGGGRLEWCEIDLLRDLCGPRPAL